MPYEQDVKELAYTLDPPAWISYSGKSRDFKAVMAPAELMHTAPLADPGSLSPSPESAVTAAVNFSAVGLLVAPRT